MNREQMIAWMVIEGVYVTDYNGNGNLYEVNAYGKSATRFYDGSNASDDEWTKFGANFDGGPIVEWGSIEDKFIESLYKHIQETFHEP